MGLEKNTKNGKSYNDNLCFFRCLALHHGFPLSRLELPTKKFAKCWNRDGVRLTDIPQLELIFKVNIQVYIFSKRQEKFRLYLGSPHYFRKTLYVLLYKNHFCYIKDINKLTKSFQCSKCMIIKKKKDHRDSHEKSCQGLKPIEKYKGGVYMRDLSVLEELHNQGINVDTNYVYPFRIVFDFECLLNPLIKENKKTRLISHHIPLSVSICSNVPHYKKPKCFITSGDSQELLNRMGDYLDCVHESAMKHLYREFKHVLQQIHLRNIRQQIRDKFIKYIEQIPVLTFNGGRYDINATKPYFIKRFVINKNGYVIKNGNNFIAISTHKFLFLDMINYITPNSSYASYLKAYGIKEAKGIFPYEYITRLDRLEETKLPPKSAFYSSLKNSNISDDEYEECKRIWKTYKMKTLKDYLVYYNNLDTKPFIDCIEVQSKIYSEEFGLDFLKDGFSIPGLTIKYLFKNYVQNTYFSLINNKNKNLHTLMRKNIVGGPSLFRKGACAHNHSFSKKCPR